MKTTFSVIAIIISLTSLGQKKGYQFFVSPQVALLNGAQSVSTQVQVVTGFQSKDWSFAIGSGFDYYIVRSAPLFADVRKFINFKNKTVFVYANAGINIIWPTQNEKSNVWDRVPSSTGNNSFGNGRYSDMGIGVLLGKKKNLMASIGYSNKTFTETYKEWIGIGPILPFPTQTPDRKLNYSLNRIVIKFGIKL